MVIRIVERRSVLRLELPWPPGNNHYYRHVGSKVLLSSAGRKYQTAVAHAVLLAGRPRALPGRLSVTLDAHPPDKRRRDLDNLPKGVLDALTGAGVYEDDSLIDRLVLTRRCVVKGGTIHVTIEVYEEGDE